MARNSLLWKLTLAFLLVAITAAALVAVMIRLTSVNRLTRLIVDQQRSSLEAVLVDYYASVGTWRRIEQDWYLLQFQSQPPPDQFQPSGERPTFAEQPGDRDRRRLFGLADANGEVIIPVDQKYPQGTVLTSRQIKEATPLVVNGEKVGSILTAQLSPRLNPEETLFLRRTNEALILATSGAMLVALFIGVILARTLIRPLQELTHAAQRIAQGHLDQQVRVTSRDEIGQLGSAFNQMSQEVARVNLQRKQMTADIAHDLRTPLTVIGGYVESMRDGVLKPTPERLALIYTEIERLQNLVGDLRMLSQADAGELPLHPQPVSPRSLLEHCAAPFQYKAAQQDITLKVEAEDTLPDIVVDEARMMQVFGNLLSNALRYTPEHGLILLSAGKQDQRMLLCVQDNGTGIPEEDLKFIFDRFHRADKSRHAESGESGLGLAIVKALIEAHGGSVCAKSSPGDGTTIEISLPLAEI